MKQLSLLVASLGLAAMAHATDPTYKMNADLSYMINKTDSATTNTLAGRALATRTVGVWAQEYRAEAAGVSGDVKAPTERYLASGKVSSELQPNTTIFGKVQLEKDRSIDLTYNATATVGLGHVFIKDGIQTLTGEVGVGNRFYKFKDMSSENGVIGTIGGHYDRKLTDKTLFSQDLGYEYGNKMDTLRSLTSVSVLLSDKISAIASYQLKRDHVKDTGTSNNQLTTFGLKYVY